MQHLTQFGEFAQRLPQSLRITETLQKLAVGQSGITHACHAMTLLALHEDECESEHEHAEQDCTDRENAGQCCLICDARFSNRLQSLFMAQHAFADTVNLEILRSGAPHLGRSLCGIETALFVQSEHLMNSADARVQKSGKDSRVFRLFRIVRNKFGKFCDVRGYSWNTRGVVGKAFWTC